MGVLQRFIFTAGAIVLFLSTLSWGQAATTSLRGTVSDPQGAVLAGTSVSLSNSSTGFSQSTKTDDHGIYQFLQLPPATYSLTVSMPGFATQKQENLQLLVNLPSSVNVAMHIRAEATTVEVQAESAQVNTENATLGNAFGASQIAALPFEGRDPAQILSLQPGVTFVGTNVDQKFDSRGGAVNGARSDQTNIVLDGIDNNDQTKGFAFQGALRSTLDSLQEFRVTTSNANADEGRSSGAQVSLVTKGGTNRFHGSAYEYNRTNVGQANDWFNKRSELQSGLPNVPGQLIRNTFGATFGGPVLKDHVFFFLAYEGQRTRESTQITRVVPSDNLRQGILSYHCADDPACPAGGIQTLTAQDLAKMDPNCPANGTCPLGAGPDPAVLALFQQYPHPNTTGGDGINFQGFTFSAPTPGSLNTYIAKLDFNLTQNHRVFVRGGLVGDNSSLGAPQFPAQPQSTVATNTSKGLIAGYAANLGPRLFNNLRYGYTRQATGDSGLQTRPYIQFGDLDSLFAFTPTDRANVPVHNFVDDVAWVKGNHTLQFGGNLRIITDNRVSNDNSFSSVIAYFLWVGQPGLARSGGSLDPAAFGFPAVDVLTVPNYNDSAVAVTGLLLQSYSNFNFNKQGTALPQGAPVVRHFRDHELEWYGQDSWHVKPNLMLTYGLRYTLLQPPYETTGTQAAPTTSMNDFFRKRAAAMVAGETYDPLISFDLSGQANGRKPYWAWDYKNLAPRVAIAWSPKAEGGFLKTLLGGPGKSSVRGGYGIYFDHFGVGIVNTFDKTGTFGLTTSIGNQVGQFGVDDAPRFTDLYSIPPALIAPTPQGGFPNTPFANTSPAIYWGLDDKLKTPYSHVFDFSITRELPKGFAFEAAYIGRLGRRLLQEEDLAMPLDIRDPKSGMDYFTAATLLAKAAENGVPLQNLAPIPFWENVFPGAAGTPPNPGNGESCAPGGSSFRGSTTATQAMYDFYSCGLHNETFPLFIADSPAFASGNLPPGVSPGPGGCYPSCATIDGKITPNAFYHQQFSSLYAWRSIGSSSYNGLQLMLRHRMAGGLQWDFNYTFSKSLDIGSNAERINQFEAFGQFDQVINSWSPKQLRAVSDFDTTHQFNTNWVYDLPFGRGRHFGASSNRLMNGLLGGWQWSGLARWTSGFPTTISTGCCFPTNWELYSSAILVGPKPQTGRFTDQNGNPNLFKDPVAAAKAFRFSYPGESGQRNELRGPGYFGIDFGLSKSWDFTESQKLKFSWEVFNVTNAVRFDVAPLPQSSNGRLDSAGTDVFGTFNSTLTKPRVMQFAMRYSF
jgi:hypothetical protein